MRFGALVVFNITGLYLRRLSWISSSWRSFGNKAAASFRPWGLIGTLKLYLLACKETIAIKKNNKMLVFQRIFMKRQNSHQCQIHSCIRSMSRFPGHQMKWGRKPKTSKQEILASRFSSCSCEKVSVRISGWWRVCTWEQGSNTSRFSCRPSMDSLLWYRESAERIRSCEGNTTTR